MASNSTAYPLSRDYKAALRLNLQHFVHSKDIGYLLHPKIPRHGEGLKIADIGTGTGIWLVDLCDQIHSSAQLDGFDVSPSQFPAKEWLPKNVSLSVLDAFGEVPEKLQKRYDVINIRYFCCVIQNNNPHSLINNVLKMLKPGGYLQWCEQDFGNQSIITANSSISPEPFDAVTREVERQTKSDVRRFQWLIELDQILREHGLVDVTLSRQAENPKYYSVWQQIFVMTSEDMSYSSPSGERIRELLRKNQEEAPVGVFWRKGHLTFIARKPETSE